MDDKIWLYGGMAGRSQSGSDLDELAFLRETQAEAIGWLPVADGAYVHVGKPDENEVVITVVGLPEASMAGMNVLLLC